MRETALCFCHILILLTVLLPGFSFGSPVSLLAPARPHPEKQADAASQPPVWETDILISLMDPFQYANLDMDIPQSLAAHEPVKNPETGETTLARRELLGDLEEIRYLDRKAWSLNAGLANPGVTHFTLETKPWWDETEQVYRQFSAKAPVVVGAVDTGWDLPVGEALEIVPLIRPFGLYSPCLFSGLAMQEGKPLANAIVKIGHINELKTEAATPWHHAMAVKTNANGEFSALLNEPGWWYCEVSRNGEPLKGPDGELKNLVVSAVFWLYIDPMPGEKTRR